MGASMTHKLGSEVNPANESQKCKSVIKHLATDLRKPETQVEAVFQSELQKLEKGSRVKSFISILAARRERVN